jgi:hypothetical protein
MPMDMKAIAAFALTALGIGVPMPDFMAGMVLALAGAYGAMLVAPPANRSNLWVTLFLAMLAGIGAAYVHRMWFAGVPVQAMMFMSGALSRWIAASIHSFGAAAQERAGTIPRSFKFPWERDGSNGGSNG